MNNPLFSADAVSLRGIPDWIDRLAWEDPNHSLYVVRGLDPAEVIGIVGGEQVRTLAPGELPEDTADEWSGVVPHALEAAGGGDLLRVAGRRGDWTFVYDTFGGMDGELAKTLSKGGRAAAYVVNSISGISRVDCAEDGSGVYELDDSYDPDYDQENVPELLRNAIDAAMAVDLEDPDWDLGVNMRIVCALAGLTWTYEEFRQHPLTIARYDE
ncbi:DUF6461 domain-containing protein [Actinoplanes sp. N902-109]|uniref:DUF6461 domain-containing protein n=1 Tax=Actinoplanes sp. (strain N902-109) TaxID=649831 RepID=UPI0003294DA9|nr:DUF6461 domain-containing protein [Actinoplanes sp. N902-109]AGL16182.1 hypothetical protein L083_2672 [Actinoplanes sp. N902-109]